MDQSCFEGTKKLTIETTEEDQLTFIELALSNTVVLREIFKFIPASDLKSCSLVNKLWKNECYAHCRDNRKWMAKISAESPCVSVREFNELVGSMALVPYNGLSLHVDQEKRSYFCQCNSPEDLFTNVMEKLNWRHLDILMDFEVTLEKRKSISCAVNRLGLALLEQKAVELESLEFNLPNQLQCHFDSNWPPALPNLKVICFPQKMLSSFYTRPFPTNFYTRLTNKAPNLKEITGLIDCEILQLLPIEKWGCVKDFKCSHYRVYSLENELQIPSQFVSKSPTLRKISLQLPCSSRPTVDFFNALIGLSQMTVEDFEIRSCEEVVVRGQDSLQMPQLPKLSILRLSMRSDFQQAIKSAQSLLTQHGGEGFPQLEEFHLMVDTFNGNVELLPISDNDENAPLPSPIQPCASVSKLRLQLDPELSGFVQIKRLFPAVTDMHISYGYYGKQSRLPYKQIFRLWQNLEKMSTCYVSLGGKSAYKLDAAFCGLHEQEVELLGQQDDNFLMAVEIVPIAPCVLTMRNLLSFTIDHPNRRFAFGDRETYLTRVARILASRYLPNVQVNANYVTYSRLLRFSRR